MDWVELFQIWLMALVTLALFSFMYRDNPVYKVAEHIFAGLTAGYQVGLIWDTVILQQLWFKMIGGDWWLFLPGILGFLMFTRFSSRFSWVSRTSLAFVMGVTAGIFLISSLHGLVLPQMRDTMKAPSEAVAAAIDEFGQNHQEFVIFDSGTEGNEAQVLDSVAVPALEDASTSLDGVSPAIVPGITRADKKSVDRLGEDQVVLRAEFKDEVDLGVGEFYAATFKIRHSVDKNSIELARSSVHSSEGITFTDASGGMHVAELSFNPVDTLALGAYDVAFEVERRSIVFSLAIIIVVGVLSTLIYFYFSKPHIGVLGVTAKVGIWFIMISFGAHFGFTVMGRVSLLIGRVQFLIEDWIGSFSQLM